MKKPEELTLRDYFAAKAMTATIKLLAKNTGQSNLPNHHQILNFIAEDCYRLADAMLKERKNK